MLANQSLVHRLKSSRVSRVFLIYDVGVEGDESAGGDQARSSQAAPGAAYGHSGHEKQQRS